MFVDTIEIEHVQDFLKALLQHANEHNAHVEV
jgi:hypothetical protein